MVDLSSAPVLGHSSVPLEDDLLLFLVFLVCVSMWPSCGASQESQIQCRLDGALVDAAQLIVGVAVAGMAFVAELVYYNWDVIDEQQVCENVNTLAGGPVIAVGGPVTVVGGAAAWVHQ